VNTIAAQRRVVDGVLLLNKPRGLTSQQAVARVKRFYSARKAGHTGTLDPMADGLLPVGLGEATKFSRFLLDADKQYLATLRLGMTTTTGDAEGEVIRQHPVALSAADLSAVLARFVGEQMQMPPMHSALKVAGKPLYAYAREGVVVERKARAISIKSMQIIDFKELFITVRVSCSKGTYIRVLAEDIGAALGCGAHLSALTREAAGGFNLATAVSLEALEALPLADRMARLLPMDAFADSLPRLDLDAAAALRLVQGQQVATVPAAIGLYRLYGPAGEFLGIGEHSAAALHAQRLVGQSAATDSPNGLSKTTVTG
jgi:tRNA pseudouridine55 synthase